MQRWEDITSPNTYRHQFDEIVPIPDVKYGAAVVVDGFHPELRSFFLELWH
jgi:hypothetical protein